MGLRARDSLRQIPAVRKLYYSMFNAHSFANLYWHDVMLADTVRMETYAHAIDKLVKPGMVVVDLGTGSGVLACLAAQRGATVHAIEHTQMIERAQVLAQKNNLSNITFHRMHSKDFNPSQKVDVILHEQIGMHLIDEDMVENIIDLRDRVLKPGGLILPGHFELFLDPIELRADRVMPYLWEQRFHGLDFSSFRPEPVPWLSGNGYDKRALEPDDVGKVLAKECSLLRLDLHTMATATLPTRWSMSRKLQKSGRLDGLAMYFKAGFDDEVFFLTGPSQTRTHWTPRLFRTEAQKVKAGQTIGCEVNAGNPTNADTWTWQHSIT